MDEVDAKKYEMAMKIYENHRKGAKRYYDTHKEQISQKRKERYRAKHPNPKPRGRPPKNQEVEVVENSV